MPDFLQALAQITLGRPLDDADAAAVAAQLLTMRRTLAALPGRPEVEPILAFAPVPQPEGR